jgi:hypothetical protein
MKNSESSAPSQVRHFTVPAALPNDQPKGFATLKARNAWTAKK